MRVFQSRQSLQKYLIFALKLLFLSVSPRHPSKLLLSTIGLMNTQSPQAKVGRHLHSRRGQKFWKKLSFFALLEPEDDILPVRMVYKGKTKNIGVNYLSSETPIWYAGPDVVASTILAGKPPKILKALQMFPHGRQSGLNQQT